MLHYSKTDISKGIDFNNTSASIERIFGRYFYLLKGIFFQISKNEVLALWKNIDMVEEIGTLKETEETYFFVLIIIMNVKNTFC